MVGIWTEYVGGTVTLARLLVSIARFWSCYAGDLRSVSSGRDSWMEKIGDPLIADAICDRCVHNAYKIVIECKESMRKRKGIPESEA